MVAATFGLVHGLAFSATLRALGLTGTRLLLSLLGFTLGIEIMPLWLVALPVTRADRRHDQAAAHDDAAASADAALV